MPKPLTVVLCMAVGLSFMIYWIGKIPKVEHKWTYYQTVIVDDSTNWDSPHRYFSYGRTCDDCGKIDIGRFHIATIPKTTYYELSETEKNDLIEIMKKRKF
jgi:hypothetical protein